MGLDQDVLADIAACNWRVITNDGTNLTAVNEKTKDTFSGTTVAFNAMISGTVPEGGDVVLSKVDPLTGGLELSGDVLQKVGPIQRPAETLGLIGDSRTENGGYFCPQPSAASISGSTLSVTAQYIGATAAVGSRIILNRNKNPAGKTTAYSYNIIVATVATVVDSHNITAAVIYPNPAVTPLILLKKCPLIGLLCKVLMVLLVPNIV